MAAPGWRNPLDNHLLRALPEADFARLRPQLELVSLVPRTSISEPGRGNRYIYFPVSGAVSLIGRTQDDGSADIAVVGREGSVGFYVMIGDASLPFEAVVLHPGHAYRGTIGALQMEFDRGGIFQHLILRCAKARMVQLTQAVICHRHHSIDQRLSKWLLLNVDRVDCDELDLTHQVIANMLGLRREDVTLAARRLQDARVLDYTRGRITIRDKAGLRAKACECYDVDRTEHDHMRTDISKFYAITRQASRDRGFNPV